MKHSAVARKNVHLLHCIYSITVLVAKNERTEAQSNCYRHSTLIASFAIINLCNKTTTSQLENNIRNVRPRQLPRYATPAMQFQQEDHTAAEIHRLHLALSQCPT